MITLDDQMKCVQRELALRHAVYPKWIAAGKMKQDRADHELAAMHAVLGTIESLASWLGRGGWCESQDKSS